MNNPIPRRLSAAAFAVLLLGGIPVGAEAQAPKPKEAKPHSPQQGRQGMSCMAGDMGDTHHALSMAYWGSLASFARTLQEQVTKAKSVDVELARPAVAEMRRSFDAITQHHQDHMQKMGTADSMKTRMMSRMDSTMTSMGNHLVALEGEVNAATPDPAKVTEHTAALLKHCGGMTGMHPATSGHRP